MSKKIAQTIFILLITIKMLSQQNYDISGNPVDGKTTNYTFKTTWSTFSTATADPPVILNSFPSPSSGVTDIAFDGVNLWVEGANDMMFYKISPLNGQILKTIPTNVGSPYGLEFVNGFLWVADNVNNLMQKVDTANGNVVLSFPTPCPSPNSYPQGLAFDGQNMWHNDAMATNVNANDSTYAINLSGSILQRFHGYGTYITGLAWDGNYLWSSDNGAHKLYKINTTNFSVIDTLEAPGGLYPNGLAFDGQHLWVSNNDEDMIYQIDVSNTNVGINELGVDNSYSIYPNPVENELNIKLNGTSAESNFKLTDLYGKILLSGVLKNETSLNTNQFAKGFYILQIDGSHHQVIKFIKQ